MMGCNRLGCALPKDAVSYDLAPILTGDGISKIVIQAAMETSRPSGPLGLFRRYVERVAPWSLRTEDVQLDFPASGSHRA